MAEIPEYFVKHLDGLKKQMMEGKEFYDAWKYFLDYLGEHEGWFDVSVRTDMRPEMAAALSEFGAQIFHSRKTFVSRPLFFTVGDNFIHGIGQVNGSLISLFYFKDVDVGMMCFVKGLHSGECLFMRFSITRVPAGKQVYLSKHPKGKPS